MIGRLHDLGPDQVGGKGSGLQRLIELGFPVPDAQVVPVDARGAVSPDDLELIRELGEPLAVRSSAVGEDAPNRSSAGQYASVMGVRLADVAEAVASVYASASSDRVQAYREGGAGLHVEMAVVIQREIASTRAGVIFSRDPLTNSPDTVVECVFGHGERLVSGEVNPDQYRVEPGGAVTARLAVKSGAGRLLRTLRDDEAVALAGLAARAAEGFGHPVDVEFCFEGPRLWLVQCRAITAMVGD